MIVSLDQLVKQFGTYLVRKEGMYFLGSGISLPSGLPDWLGLIQSLAAPLGIDVSTHDNLPQIAQYCVNKAQGNRGPLIGRLKRALSLSRVTSNPYHTSIRRTNISTIWTTNFDTLLEARCLAGRLAIRANDHDLTAGANDFDVELLKAHGCMARSNPDEIVLTLEDYEEFSIRRPAIAERLRHDLTHSSMLFAGYGYNDPNIQTVFVEARRLSKGTTREHFLIAKQEQDGKPLLLQKLWAEDLSRVGIQVALINEYSQLVSALEDLALASRGKSVFVTGSHTGSTELARKIGERLALEKEVVLLDGQSEGIGRMALNAFGQKCIEKKYDIRQRIRYFPNPYSFNPSFAKDPQFLETLRQWRSSLLRAAHTVIVFNGGMGTKAEVDVAREMGTIIIPVPSSKKKSYTYNLFQEDAVKNRLTPAYVHAVNNSIITVDHILECVKGTFPK